MEGLEFNNILGEQEIETLFNEPEEQPAEETVMKMMKQARLLRQ